MTKTHTQSTNQFQMQTTDNKQMFLTATIREKNLKYFKTFFLNFNEKKNPKNEKTPKREQLKCFSDFLIRFTTLLVFTFTFSLSFFPSNQRKY